MRTPVSKRSAKPRGTPQSARADGHRAAGQQLARKRTELAVILTPRVTASDQDIESVTREFRGKLDGADLKGSASGLSPGGVIHATADHLAPRPKKERTPDRSTRPRREKRSMEASGLPARPGTSTGGGWPRTPGEEDRGREQAEPCEDLGGDRREELTRAE